MASLTASYFICEDRPGRFYVHRTLSGDDVQPGEPRTFTSEGHDSLDAAKSFAAKAALRFAERYPGAVVTIDVDAALVGKSLVAEARVARRAA